MKQISILICITALFLGCNANADNNPQQDAISSVTPAGGDFIQMIYITSGTCAYCTSDETITMVNEISDALEYFAQETNFKLWRTAVSGVQDINKELEHIQKTGPFNEIIAGGLMYNLGYMEYVWGENNAPPVTPQIIINMATLEIEPSGQAIGDAHRYEREVARYIGMEGLTEFHNLLNQNETSDILREFGLL